MPFSLHICITLLEGELLVTIQTWGGFHGVGKVAFGADVTGSPVRTMLLSLCLKTQRLTFEHMPWHFWTKSTSFESENRELDQGSRRHPLGVHTSPLSLCSSEACLITQVLPCMSTCSVTETLPLLKPENNL